MHLFTSMLSREYKWATEPLFTLLVLLFMSLSSFFNVTFVLVLPIHNSHQSANSFWPRQTKSWENILFSMAMKCVSMLWFNFILDLNFISFCFFVW